MLGVQMINDKPKVKEADTNKLPAIPASQAISLPLLPRRSHAGRPCRPTLIQVMERGVIKQKEAQ
jgi:hypothetical protein